MEKPITLWQINIAMENPPFLMVYLPDKMGFSPAGESLVNNRPG